MNKQHYPYIILAIIALPTTIWAYDAISYKRELDRLDENISLYESLNENSRTEVRRDFDTIKTNKETIERLVSENKYLEQDINGHVSKIAFRFTKISQKKCEKEQYVNKDKDCENTPKSTAKNAIEWLDIQNSAKSLGVDLKLK